MRWLYGGPKRHPVRCAAAALAVVGVAALVAPSQAEATEASCQDLNFPVSILGTSQSMHGRLCAPPGARTVQVLVPGSTYTSVYWDSPVTPETRSFRLAMNNAGYATLAVDRLSSGTSSTPPIALVTTFTQADAVHQVIQALRSGAQGPRFDKVIVAGHSLGSAIAMVESGTYHDVDGVLVTGLAHRLNVVTALPMFGSLIPAVLDAKLAKRGLEPGYLTTRDGTRYDAFQKPGPMVPAVAALDEATKDVVAPGEIVDAALLGILLPYTLRITAPTMVAMGGSDPGFCGLLSTDCSSSAALRQSEAPYYPAAAKLQTYVLPGYGHSINYAPNAPDYHKAVMTWADSMIGR